jgi:hypothetical protein
MVYTSAEKHMNIYWQNFRKYCGPWPFNGTTGSVASTSCATASSALQQNAQYVTPQGSKINVPASLIDSIRRGLWSNSALAG